MPTISRILAATVAIAMLAQVSYASAQSSNKKEVMQKKETMQKQGSAKKEVMQQKGAMQKQGSISDL